MDTAAYTKREHEDSKEDTTFGVLPYNLDVFTAFLTAQALGMGHTSHHRHAFLPMKALRGEPTALAARRHCGDGLEWVGTETQWRARYGLSI